MAAKKQAEQDAQQKAKDEGQTQQGGTAEGEQFQGSGEEIRQGALQSDQGAGAGAPDYSQGRGRDVAEAGGTSPGGDSTNDGRR